MLAQIGERGAGTWPARSSTRWTRPRFHAAQRTAMREKCGQALQENAPDRIARPNPDNGRSGAVQRVQQDEILILGGDTCIHFAGRAAKSRRTGIVAMPNSLKW